MFAGSLFKKNFQLALSAFSILLLSNTASALPLVATFSGTVDYVDSALSGTFSIGDTLSGTYVFESTTVARSGSNSNFAVYDALSSLDFTIGSYSASSSAASEIQVDNDPGSPDHDRYGLVSRASDGLSGPNVGGYPPAFFGFRLDDATDTVFSDALNLPTSLALGSFTSSAFFLIFDDHDNFPSVGGTMTSVRISQVPEPTSMLLLISGLAGGVASRRKASKR